MRAPLVLALITACGSRSPAPAVPAPAGGAAAPPARATQALPASRVAAAASLAAVDGAPPIVVILDAAGQRHLAAAASWADLSAGKLSSGPKAAGPVAAARTIAEAIGLGQAPKEAVDNFVDYRTHRELNPDGPTDDPPPPVEDDDESGGSGTAMALEEAQRRGSVVTTSDPIAGQRGWVWPSARPPGAPAAPTRQATIAGEVTSDRLEDVPAVVVAAPTGKASALVQVITETRGLIAVMHDGQLRPLRLMFHPRRGVRPTEVEGWLEARLEPTGVVVEAVPSPSTTLTPADLQAGKLPGALAEARARLGLEAHTPIDVLVTPDVDIQRLIDALVALDAAGAKVIGLGLAPKPGSEQAKLRGRALPVVSVGTPSAQGDLDMAVIRAKVNEHRYKLTYCYEKELLAKPALSGTVMAVFHIRPDGKVASSMASGVDPALARCVADVIQQIQFPKPKGGGIVQVSYPFIFRK